MSARSGPVRPALGQRPGLDGGPVRRGGCPGPGVRS